MKTFLTILISIFFAYVISVFYSVNEGGHVRIDLENIYKIHISPLRTEIETALLKNTPIESKVYKNIKVNSYQFDIKVRNNGEIIFKMLSPSLLAVFSPSLQEGKVIWNCVSAPDNITGIICGPYKSSEFFNDTAI